jgi:hypothetical protein
MFQERSFSSSITTDQTEDTTARDGQGDVIQRHFLPKTTRDILDFNDGRNTVARRSRCRVCCINHGVVPLLSKFGALRSVDGSV